MARTTAEVLGARIERLQRRLNKAERDAKRYRWLKQEMYCKYGWPDYTYRFWCGIYSDNDNLDKTIDKEMERGNDEKGLQASG